MGTVAKPTWFPWFENKKGDDFGSIFIHSDSGHAKADKPREMKQKQEEVEMEPWQKRVVNHTLDINFIA